jgi:tetratricopeptide (TPR) repeat protein
MLKSLSRMVVTTASFLATVMCTGFSFGQSSGETPPAGNAAAIGEEVTETDDEREFRLLCEKAGAADRSGDFAKAHELWNEAANFLAERIGEGTWQVINARIEAQTALTQSGFTAGQRAQAAEIKQLEARASEAAANKDWNAVIENMNQACTIAAGLFGERSCVVARIRTQTGQIAHNLREPGEVWEYYHSAHSILSEVMGKNHPEVEALNYSLGNLLLINGKHEQAIPWFTEAVSASKLLFGERSAIHADRLGSLGTAVYQKGDPLAARGHLEMAAGIQKEVLGEGNARYAQTLVDLGIACLATKQNEAAAGHLQTATAIFESTIGPDQPATIGARTHLATAMVLTGNSEEAERQLRAVQTWHKNASPPNPAASAAVAYKLAILLGRKKRFEEAETLLRDAIGQQQQSLGNTHTETLRSLTALATLLDKAGRTAEAVQVREYIQQTARAPQETGATIRR